VALARAVIAAIPLALGGSTSLLAQAHYGVSWSAAAISLSRPATNRHRAWRNFSVNGSPKTRPP